MSQKYPKYTGLILGANCCPKLLLVLLKEVVFRHNWPSPAIPKTCLNLTTMYGPKPALNWPSWERTLSHTWLDLAEYLVGFGKLGGASGGMEVAPRGTFNTEKILISKPVITYIHTVPTLKKK